MLHQFVDSKCITIKMVVCRPYLARSCEVRYGSEEHASMREPSSMKKNVDSILHLFRYLDGHVKLWLLSLPVFMECLGMLFDSCTQAIGGRQLESKSFQRWGTRGG